MSNVVIREDTEDRFRWDTITSVFDDNGDLFERFIENDDGTTKLEEYFEGQLRFVEETDLNPDGSPSDARPWETRTKEYTEDGQILASFEKRDDGVEILKDFENGMLRFLTETDLNDDGTQSDARIWETRFREYAEDGQLLFTFEKHDDGVTIERDYQDGQLQFVTQTDLNEDGSASDARIWETRFTEYADDGQLLLTFEKRDDGVTIERDYQDGQLQFVTQTDLNEDGSASDARIWETRFTEYAEDGQLLLTFEKRDDGVTIEKDYQDGALFSVLETDLNEDGSASDARIWETRFTDYDESGQKLQSYEVRDNGVTIATQYENGVISARIMEDRDEFGAMTDTEGWDTFIFIYDETGTLESRRQDFDNGDVTVTLLENGQNAVRLQLDGDDDKPWYLRETLYDADGSVAEVNTYAAPEDVPSQYDFLADEMVFVA